MTQHEYLKELEDALSPLDPKDRVDLIENFKEHFEIGQNQGKSEAEIIVSLGSVKDLIEALDLKANQETTTQQPLSNDFGDIENIKIDGLHADVTITCSSDDQAHVLFDEGRSRFGKLSYEFETKTENKTLNVIIRPSSKIFRHSLDPLELEVQVPKHLIKLEIKTASGDIQIGALMINELIIDSAAGDIELESVLSKTIQINGASSDIQIETSKGELILKTVSGDIAVDDHEGETVTISTVSGDLDYSGAAQQFKVGSTSGDGSLEFSNAETVTISTVSGDFELNFGKDEPGLQVECTTASGELTVRNTDHDTPRRHEIITVGDGKINVSLKSVSGDFEIK